MVSCTELTSTSPKPENPYAMTAQAALPQAALLFNNSKDSRWLTLEVCREFQRNRCTRTEEECKFAHPPPHVDQQNGRVMCCFDSIKGKCQRKEPPCKYLHPPQHLKEQLLQNGRQNLAIKYHWNQVLAQNQIAHMPTAAPLMPGIGGIPAMPGMAGHVALDGNRYLSAAAAANAGVLHTGLTNQQLITPSPYLYNQYAGMPAAAPMSAGIGQLPLQFAVSQGAPSAAPAAATLESQALAQIPSTSTSSTTPTANGQKAPRADRLEPQPLLGLGQNQTASVAPATALPTAMSMASQAPMNAYSMYQNAALGMHAGLAGAYQAGLANPMAASAGQLSAAAAGSATGASLQAVAASAATQDAVQQQAKKRPREDELLLSMQGMPGMGVPIKRQALDAKSGIPMFNPAAYPQLAYAQQQPAYVPSVSSQMTSPSYQLLSNGSAGNSANGEQGNATGALPRIQLMSNNVDNVNYYDDNAQLLDTLPVCRDYRSGQCNRPACKYIHLLDDHVEVSDGKVTVCRDNVKNKCLRSNCKYFHLPWYVLLRPTQNQ